MSSDRLKYVVFGALVPLFVSIDRQGATAKPAYGSYFGVSPAVSVSGSNPEEQSLGGAVGVRYKFLKVPISVRTQALIGGGNAAIVPTVSYDIPLNWQTDAYVGAGVVLAGGNSLSPVGDRNSFAIQPGIDYALPNSNTVIFGNAIIAVDGYKGSGGNAISIQGGIGWRF